MSTAAVIVSSNCAAGHAVNAAISDMKLSLIKDLPALLPRNLQVGNTCAELLNTCCASAGPTFIGTTPFCGSSSSICRGSPHACVSQTV
mgnify:CR=1 FL=1